MIIRINYVIAKVVRRLQVALYNTINSVNNSIIKYVFLKIYVTF